MFIIIHQCICSNVPKNLLIICPHPPLTPPSPLNRTVFTQRLVSDHVYEVNMAIATWSPFLSIRKSKYQRDIAAKMKRLCYLICTSHLSRSLGGIDERNSNTSCSVWIVGRNGLMGMVSLTNSFKFCRLNWK